MHIINQRSLFNKLHGTASNGETGTMGSFGSSPKKSLMASRAARMKSRMISAARTPPLGYGKVRPVHV